MSAITKPILLDATGQETNALLEQLVAVQKVNVLSGGNAGAADLLYRGLVNAASSVAEVNNLFIEWWKSQWTEGQTTRNELCARWFGSVLNDERVHGVRFPLFSISQSPAGELLNDSVGLVAVPSTASVAGRDDFAYLPQFWCLEVSMERHADGTHTIYAVEHIDNQNEVRSGHHLCQVLQKNTYTREWLEGGYHYMQMQCTPAAGFETWAQGTGKNGTVYPYIANPKYYAGKDADGKVTCGTGLAPINWTSHVGGVSLWRARGSHYSGVAGNLLKWQNAMFWMKYARKGNSGTIEGCSSAWAVCFAAVSEESAERLLLSEADASRYFVGCSVHVGTNKSGANNAWAGDSWDIFSDCRIKSMTGVLVSGQSYVEVTFSKNKVFDVVKGKTMITFAPYYSGWNDGVLGFDGSRYNYTNGKEPGLIQKTEFMNGAYIILSDELWQWSKDSEGNFLYDCYTCHDQSKVTTDGTISEDYIKQSDLTLRFEASETAGWRYIGDIAIGQDRGVMWPAKVSTTAGSGTGAKAGFYAELAESGVRAGWCCCYLADLGAAGLPARDSLYTTTAGDWAGCVGVPSGISG